MAVGEFQPDLRPAWTNATPPAPLLNPDGSQQTVPQTTHHQLPWPGDSTISQISAETWFSLSKGWSDETISGLIYFIGENPDGTPNYFNGSGQPFTLTKDVRMYWVLPTGTDKVSVSLDPHYHPVGWCFEVKGQ